MVESSHKLDILRLALEKRIRDLPTESMDKIQQIKDELATGKSLVGCNHTCRSWDFSFGLLSDWIWVIVLLTVSGHND